MDIARMTCHVGIDNHSKQVVPSRALEGIGSLTSRVPCLVKSINTLQHQHKHYHLTGFLSSNASASTRCWAAPSAGAPRARAQTRRSEKRRQHLLVLARAPHFASRRPRVDLGVARHAAFGSFRLTTAALRCGIELQLQARIRIFLFL